MIMISYARADLPAVVKLVDDLELAHEETWIDRELAGGQAWWDTILEMVRQCDVLIVALSSSFLNSRACRAELDYAARLGKVVLPVMVEDVAVQLAPAVIANAQIVDYRTRSVENAIALVSAIKDLPPSPPMPESLPEPPDPPISYMSSFSEQIDADNLSYRDQIHLVAELKAFLGRSSDHAVAAQLLRRLRDRPDITEKVGRDIDELLDSIAAADPEKTPAQALGSSPTEEAAPSRAPSEVARDQEHRRRGHLLILAAAATALTIAAVTLFTLAPGRGSSNEPQTLPVSTPLAPTQLVVPMDVGGGNWELFLGDTSSRRPIKKLTSDEGYVIGPVLSPDRKTLMYISATTRGAYPRSLRVAGAADLSGDRAFALPSGCVRAVRPAWNPQDASMIALICLRADETQVLQLMTTGGELKREIDAPKGLPRMGDPAFTSDGKHLCFWAASASDNQDGGDLYIVPTSGGSPEPLLKDPKDKGVRDMDPVFSRDGKYVAFTRRSSSPAGDRAQVMRARSAGTKTIALTDDKAARTDPSWSVDGTHIAYTSNEPSDDWPDATTNRIWTMTVDGQRHRLLWTDEAAGEQSSAAWTAR